MGDRSDLKRAAEQIRSRYAETRDPKTRERLRREYERIGEDLKKHAEAIARAEQIRSRYTATNNPKEREKLRGQYERLEAAFKKKSEELRRKCERIESAFIAEHAKRLARTEVMRAHAEASLNTFEAFGVEGVKTNAEFCAGHHTAKDKRTCPKCLKLNGEIFTVKSARGIIPVHPNCRCSWVPTDEKSTMGKDKGTAGGIDDNDDGSDELEEG